MPNIQHSNPADSACGPALALSIVRSSAGLRQEGSTVGYSPAAAPPKIAARNRHELANAPLPWLRREKSSIPASLFAAKLTENAHVGKGDAVVNTVRLVSANRWSGEIRRLPDS